MTLNTLPRTSQSAGFPGLAAAMLGLMVISGINDRPRTAQVSTVTVDTAANSSNYTITLLGVDITVTSDSSATGTEIATLLAAAINAEALVAGAVTATSAAAVVTVTARVGGNAFTLTTADVRLTVATSTANDTADPIPYGVGVLRLGSHLVAQPDGALAPLTPVHVVTLTPAVANAAVYAVSIIVAGITYPFAITSDGSATAAEIVTALIAAVNGGLPANSVLASGTDTLLLTSEVPGQTFTVLPSANLSMAITAQGMEIGDLLAGVVLRHDQNENPVASDMAGYPANSVIPIANKGEVWVATETDVTDLNALVYMRISGSGTKGAFRSTPATGFVALPRERCRWERRSTSTLASVRVNAI
jgi:hypothetical protein